MAPGIKYKNTEALLNSLDGMEKAAAPGFFYAKVQARMQRATGETRRQYSFQPAYAFALLLFFLVINIAVLLNGKTSSQVMPSNVERFADAYGLHSFTMYE